MASHAGFAGLEPCGCVSLISFEYVRRVNAAIFRFVALIKRTPRSHLLQSYHQLAQLNLEKGQRYLYR